LNYLYLPQSTSQPPFVGRVVEWLLPSGSKISMGEPYLAIETEKVVSELCSKHEGWLYYSQHLSSDLLLSHETPVAAIAEQRLPAPDEKALLDFLNSELGARKINPDSLFMHNPDLTPPPTEVATKATLPLAKLFEARQLTYSASQAVFTMVAIHIELEPVEEKIRLIRASEKLAVSIGELVTYELSRILLKYPELNACFLGGETYFYHQLNLGLSININGKGLKVVSIPQADQKDIREISAAVKDLSLCYLRGELTEDNFRDITFSISDMSSLGATDMIPTLNIRQSAILGICAPNKNAQDFKLCLGIDHRVADGTIGMTMLRKLKDSLEREL
jgi:pyruvate/2-oxoglutarate dehydrogenase complex dihydrolipoamide acyltransferase (E2) component